ALSKAAIPNAMVKVATWASMPNTSSRASVSAPAATSGTTSSAALMRRSCTAGGTSPESASMSVSTSLSNLRWLRAKNCFSASGRSGSGRGPGGRQPPLVDEDGDDALATPQALAHLPAHVVLRIVEAPPGGVSRAEPSRADQHEDVGCPLDLRVEPPPPFLAGVDAVHVHED